MRRNNSISKIFPQCREINVFVRKAVNKYFHVMKAH
jgi:hypothetical protein